jgi:2-C-methyl-D-erythritol 4-phosphate cytidylyltransferase
MTVTAILLAGGSGSRCGSSTPKQYLPLSGRPIILHSFEKLAASPSIHAIIVVCEEPFQSLLPSHPKLVGFAKPGARRQDSLYNGLKVVPAATDLILVHDSARPFATTEECEAVIRSASENGAASVAIPATATIREVTGKAVRLLDRSLLWEMQTPQAVQIDLLQRGFERALKEDLTVTDDVALSELCGVSPQIIKGSTRNIKITSPTDLLLAEILLSTHGS